MFDSLMSNEEQDQSVEAFYQRYRAAGLEGSPCAPQDVATLEQAWGPLPAAYKAYLLVAGREPPPRLVGTDCTLHRLYSFKERAKVLLLGSTLKEWANELLLESGCPILPARAFVFYMHQGYFFGFFIADGATDDPPTFSYYEGNERITQDNARFSDFVFGVAKPLQT